MSTEVLTNRQVNTTNPIGSCEMEAERRSDEKSIDYHQGALQSKIVKDIERRTYVSPSDTIMSPCSAKLNAYRNKQVVKAKPKALFAKTLTKNLSSGPFSYPPKSQDSMMEEIFNS